MCARSFSLLLHRRCPEMRLGVRRSWSRSRACPWATAPRCLAPEKPSISKTCLDRLPSVEKTMRSKGSTSLKPENYNLPRKKRKDMLPKNPKKSPGFFDRFRKRSSSERSPSSSSSKSNDSRSSSTGSQSSLPSESSGKSSRSRKSSSGSSSSSRRRGPRGPAKPLTAALLASGCGLRAGGSIYSKVCTRRRGALPG